MSVGTGSRLIATGFDLLREEMKTNGGNNNGEYLHREQGGKYRNPDVVMS